MVSGSPVTLCFKDSSKLEMSILRKDKTAIEREVHVTYVTL